MIDNTQLL